MCPLPPQCWATRNTQIKFGEGETHASVSRFLTRMFLIILSNLKGNEKKNCNLCVKAASKYFSLSDVKWMLHSLKLTARNSSNGNTLHYAERLASSTVNSRFGFLMFIASNFCIFFYKFFVRIIRVTLELLFGERKNKWSHQTSTQFFADTLFRLIVVASSLYIYLLAVAVFFLFLSSW